mmetsp:Transcript_15769/g.19227  ORF Transcript_15769/g.19227 Transcript_15769/m.19227 type:complete len:370 (+) Transcript_15769:201-1310(+)
MFNLKFLSILLFYSSLSLNSAFTPTSSRSFIQSKTLSSNRIRWTKLDMSFYSDSSDYKSSDSDFTSDDDAASDLSVPVGGGDEEDSPTIEETPVPMSKNSGNRFIAFVFDRSLSNDNDDVLELHNDRIELTEQHVLFCRKANLYNETFNSESMADILWSHQILSSDLKRVIGHAMCIESSTVEYAKDALSNDPIVQHLTGGDVSNIPLYRWRHIRDITLRQDDGRDGVPFMLLSMDRSAEEGVGNLREKLNEEYLEYLIRSERVISAGPLHLLTGFKDDPSSIAVGDIMFFNAPNREDAISFAENTPSARAGLYHDMKMHRFNSLDVTGKYVAEDLVNPEKSKHVADMKEALEYWGYPVDDRQTKWLNW